MYSAVTNSATVPQPTPKSLYLLLCVHCLIGIPLLPAWNDRKQEINSK